MQALKNIGAGFHGNETKRYDKAFPNELLVLSRAMIQT